jgi:sucrose phosphorylase
MVYNFSLPPLTLHAFHTGSAEILTKWAAALSTPSTQTTFFNFLASHDGIGLMPARGMLSDDDISKMAARVQAVGGFVSYKNNPDGSQSPYELNVNFVDALSDPENPESDVELVAKRFLATQSIMLALRGVPGVYFHSLFGSRNWVEGVEQTGRNRSINREKLDRERLEPELADPNSLRYHVFKAFHHMLKVRKTNPAFHPWGEQQVLSVDKGIFALLRTSLDGDTHTLCLHNVTAKTINLKIDLAELPFDGLRYLLS